MTQQELLVYKTAQNWHELDNSNSYILLTTNYADGGKPVTNGIVRAGYQDIYRMLSRLMHHDNRFREAAKEILKRFNEDAKECIDGKEKAE